MAKTILLQIFHSVMRSSDLPSLPAALKLFFTHRLTYQIACHLQGQDKRSNHLSWRGDQIAWLKAASDFGSGFSHNRKLRARIKADVGTALKANSAD
jgi:hypothetical protein